jgi:hypothetical protein
MTLFLAFPFVQKILSRLRVRGGFLIGARAAAPALPDHIMAGWLLKKGADGAKRLARTRPTIKRYGVFSKSNYGGKWKLSGSRGGFDAGARRTAPEGGRGPQAF